MGQVLGVVKASRQYVSLLQSETLRYLTVSFRRHHPHDGIGQAYCRFKQVGRHNRAHGEALGYIQQSPLDSSY